MDAIISMIEEIKKCQASEAHVSAMAMSFVCIDAMAFLGMPSTQTKQSSKDFIRWVDKYMKADSTQVYQYSGLDVYGARCAMIHQFGSEADFHQQNPTAKKFGYHDGGKHFVNAGVDNLVLISMLSFTNDLVHALKDYVSEISQDSDLRLRVESRMPKILSVFPFYFNLG